MRFVVRASKLLGRSCCVGSFLGFSLLFRRGTSFCHYPGLSLHAEARVRHWGQRLLDEKVRVGLGNGTRHSFFPWNNIRDGQCLSFEQESAAVTDLQVLPAPLRVGRERRKGGEFPFPVLPSALEGWGAGKEPVVLGSPVSVMEIPHGSHHHRGDSRFSHKPKDRFLYGNAFH